MSVLAINIGNTNIHLGMREDNGIQTKTVILQDSEQLERQFKAGLASFEVKKITEVRISSVNPDYTQKIVSIVTQIVTQSVHIIDYNDLWTVNYECYEKGKLGIDRMLVCEAAYKRKELPAIIFDFGTATTMNVVSESGDFLGGAIFPGIYMGVRALSEKTALLPQVLLDTKEPQLLGTSTIAAIQSAALYGNKAMIEGMISQVEQGLKKQAHVYITGGAASVLYPLLTREVMYEKDLLLEGILGLD